MTKGVSAWVLSLCLFLLAAFVAIVTTVGSPTYIKSALYQTGFYNNIVGASLTLLTTNNAELNSQQYTSATIKTGRSYG